MGADSGCVRPAGLVGTVGDVQWAGVYAAAATRDGRRSGRGTPGAGFTQRPTAAAHPSLLGAARRCRQDSLALPAQPADSKRQRRTANPAPASRSRPLTKWKEQKSAPGQPPRTPDRSSHAAAYTAYFISFATL